MITVFYDGKCNLCSKEIKYYKSIADENVFNWFDIANDPKHLKSINISQPDALMLLHATAVSYTHLTLPTKRIV